MPSVLIVDDDRANRDAFARILAHAGFEVAIAEHGVAALDTLNTRDFDVIVSDVKMPELSGKGFYEQLEELFPQSAGRVVFVTAYADDPKLQDFFKAAGQPVLGKPVELGALVEAVREIAAKPFSGEHR